LALTNALEVNLAFFFSPLHLDALQSILALSSQGSGATGDQLNFGTSAGDDQEPEAAGVQAQGENVIRRACK
jgi:hypothetical protein